MRNSDDSITKMSRATQFHATPAEIAQAYPGWIINKMWKLKGGPSQLAYATIIII